MERIIQQLPVVFAACNEGFFVSVKLFVFTLLGALPLGLVISFCTMNKWVPFKQAGLRLKAKKIQQGGLTKFESTLQKFFLTFRPISGIFEIIVWIIRGTPLMLQLIILYYLPGYVFDNPIWGSGENGRFIASVVAFIINYACYFAEIYRGGIQAVPKGQTEAGEVLGMTKTQIFFKVTLLQMIKNVVPPLGNEFITLIKDTSLSRIIALQELIFAGFSFLKGSHGISGAIWPLFFTGIYYLFFTAILTILLKRFEKRLSYF